MSRASRPHIQIVTRDTTLTDTCSSPNVHARYSPSHCCPCMASSRRQTWRLMLGCKYFEDIQDSQSDWTQTGTFPAGIRHNHHPPSSCSFWSRIRPARTGCNHSSPAAQTHWKMSCRVRTFRTWCWPVSHTPYPLQIQSDTPSSLGMCSPTPPRWPSNTCQRRSPCMRRSRVLSCRFLQRTRRIRLRQAR